MISNESDSKLKLSSISGYSTATTTDAVYIIGGYDFVCDCYLSTVAKYKNHQWYHVEDLHERRAYHGSITVGGKTMVIGGINSEASHGGNTISTELLMFSNNTTVGRTIGTTIPTSFQYSTVQHSTGQPSTMYLAWNDTEHCENYCSMYDFPETSNSSIAEAEQSIIYHGTKMEPKLHWGHATGFGLYEVDSDFCRYETDVTDITTTTTPITTSIAKTHNTLTKYPYKIEPYKIF